MPRTLVTGAAGFVGAWVVETFQLCGLPVRAAFGSGTAPFDWLGDRLKSLLATCCPSPNCAMQ